MRRAATIVSAGVVSAGLVLAGCGSGDGDGDGAGTGGDGPVTLTFQSLAFQPESIEANQQIIEQWNADNPDIQVEYLQGDWASVQDQLVTAFEGGTAPDLVHYESSYLQDFADRGWILDITDLVPDEMTDDILDGAWEAVTFDDSVYAVPFLLDAQVIFANKALLDAAGIAVPAPDDPWTWDEFADISTQLTDADTFGVAWTLKDPANRMLNLAMNFGGGFFEESDGASTAIFGDAEKEAFQRIHDQLYVDKSAATDAIGMGGSDPLPGFFAGQYAMLPKGIWFRQQIIDQAPEGFEYVTIPALEGDSQTQAAAPQTISVAAESEHPEEAMAFLEYMLSPENQALLAKGDWMIPASAAAAEDPVLTETPDWPVAAASGTFLEQAPFQRVRGYEEWKNKVANPSIEEFFANAISLDDLGTRLTEDGNEILERYNR
ncbi:ABC transporter substrate-binding protein [Jiangella alba]|uniref:ABC-type glycerol-3-phosphate transport system, substrate-binding protein n=1 Tax=Jiangella alba TaxID=561176 RepID=A0A1H5IIE6_9ACTN|nr:sugar ABC transporter substrate-binding protein [Jiangella alba]SEE40002.1 ABC-type glycerol-3-phosphate transport system, substrate-binding protein [Jiangella alba]